MDEQCPRVAHYSRTAAWRAASRQRCPHDGRTDTGRLRGGEHRSRGVDLASLSPGVAAAFGDVDHDLLSLLRLLNSARVATWGWALADHAFMRKHAEHHLALVRRAGA